MYSNTGGARLLARRPVGVRQELALERGEETLGHGIVPTIPVPTHAARHAVDGEKRLVVVRCDWLPAIGVMQSARAWPGPR